MADVKIDAELLFKRLEKIQSHWLSHQSSDWDGADAICIPMGTSNSEQVNYSKPSAFHLYLLGYEFPETIMLLTKNEFFVMAHPKKCGYIENAAKEKPDHPIKIKCFPKGKDEAANQTNFNILIDAIKSNGGKKIATILKGEFLGNFIPSWTQSLAASDLDRVECSVALAKVFSEKDDSEIELCKRAAVLSNKVLKHGFVVEMEDIIGIFLILLTLPPPHILTYIKH